jgi:hypothetical protein
MTYGMELHSGAPNVGLARRYTRSALEDARIEE